MGARGAMQALSAAAVLLAADMAALAALATLAPVLAPWLEATVRFAALAAAGWLLGAPWAAAAATAAVLSVAPAAVLALRPRAAPAWPLLAASGPAWPLLVHGAAALARLTWRLLWRPEAPADARGARATLWRLLRLTAPEWPHLSGAFIFLTLTIIGETLVPFYTGKVIDLLKNEFNHEDFTSAIVLMGLASLGSSVFAGCRGGFFLWVLSRLNTRVCDRLFSHLLRQEMAFFEQVKAADLTSRLAHDVPMMNQVVPINANIFLRNLVKTVVLLAFMGRLSWHLTVLALAEVPLAVAARKLYDVRRQALLQAILEATARASAVAHEAVVAIETVQGFGAEAGEVERYARVLDETRRLKERRDLEQSLFLLFHRALRVAAQALVLYCAHQHIAQGSLTAGGLVSFVLYQGDLSSHLQGLVYAYGNTLSSVGAAHKVFEYLDREPAVPLDGTWAPATLRGHVVFQNVTFAYPTRPEEPALQDVSFELRPGEVTALAGPNGSGKSTCVALLERFYEPQAGAVLLDGVPLRDYEHEYLHGQVALVAQEPVLFSGSIRDNITYGLEGCSVVRVEAAARAAGAWPFICALEQGLDTDVGEKGGRLSAGQKQQVAIARALLRRPAVLVLDEAASALDADGEQALQRVVREGGARTVLLVSHRRRALEGADRVVVLQGGAVAEAGPPAELLARGGAYAHLLRGE